MRRSTPPHPTARELATESDDSACQLVGRRAAGPLGPFTRKTGGESAKSVADRRMLRGSDRAWQAAYVMEATKHVPGLLTERKPAIRERQHITPDALTADREAGL